MTAPRAARPALLASFLWSWGLPAHGASFCEPEMALRIDAVEVGPGSVDAVEIRNIGPSEGSFAGVELVVTAGVDGALAEAVREGAPTIHRLLFPPDTRLAPGEVLVLGLRGGFGYKRMHGVWPDLERPVRGGDPEVPDLRPSTGWSRLGAAPEVVGLVCPARSLDLSRMAVVLGAGRVQAPPWTAPVPEEPPPDDGPEAPDPEGPAPCPCDGPAPEAPSPPPAPVVPPPLPVARRTPWDVDTRGFGGFFLRAFTPDDDDRTHDLSYGPEVQATLRLKRKQLEVVAQGYALADVQDGAERGVFTAQDAFVGAKQGRWRLRVGVQALTWTSLEVFRPADTVNARFLDGDLADPARLGEPMVEGRVLFGSWSVQAFVMPVYVASVLPASTSRRSPLPGVEVGDPIWIDASGARSTDAFGAQGALRVAGTVGPLDLALSAVRHVDRQAPLLVADAPTGTVRPVYLPVVDLGWTSRFVAGPVSLTSEGAWRDFGRVDATEAWGGLPDRDHLATAAGVDLTFDGGRATHTLLVEGQVLLGIDAAPAEELTPFQRDVVGAYRLDLNDRAGRSALVGAVVDVATPDRVYGLVGYQQRLFDVLTAELEVLGVRAPVGDALDPIQLERLDGDLQVGVRLARYF